jgi:peptidyl-prolyl cis-trans isomerase D
MLHFIRERAQGWIAWFIVALISIPFALWGINSYIGGATEIDVAKVDGQSITQTEYQRQLQQYRERMRNMMGEQFDPSMFDNDEVKKSLLDDLIEQKLIELANAKLGQNVTDAQLAQLIHSTPVFQTDGKFDATKYATVISQAGLYSPAYYEAQLRKDLLAQELVGNIQKSSFVTDKSLNNLLRLDKQSREIAYGVIPAQDFVEQVTISDEQTQQYFDDNKQQYMAPERVAVDYIELSVDELKSAVEVTETELKQYYAANQSQFVGPEQRRVSHILIEGDDEAARAAIDAAKQRITNGEAFAEVAKQLSQDTGSAQQGGDLGFFEKGVMDAAFEEASFALNDVGEVSDIVQSEFGYHLIKLTEIAAPEGLSFADAKADVERKFRQQQAETAFYEKSELLADLTYENPDNLDLAADELGLEVKSTEPFTRQGGSGIASNKKVAEAAFSDDVLINDENSSVLELSKMQLVVIHKKQHIEESLLPYESVAPAIKESLKFEKAVKLATEKGKELTRQLEQGSAADTLFSAGNWHASQTTTRQNDKLSQQLLQHAFSMKYTPSKTSYSGFSASNGNYIVVALSAVTDGDASLVEEEEKQGLKANLQRLSAEAEIKAYIDSLKASADIEVFEENL